MHKKLLSQLDEKLDKLEASHEVPKLKRYLKTEKKLRSLNKRLKA